MVCFTAVRVLSRAARRALFRAGFAVRLKPLNSCYEKSAHAHVTWSSSALVWGSSSGGCINLCQSKVAPLFSKLSSSMCKRNEHQAQQVSFEHPEPPNEKKNETGVQWDCLHITTDPCCSCRACLPELITYAQTINTQDRELNARIAVGDGVFCLKRFGLDFAFLHFRQPRIWGWPVPRRSPVGLLFRRAA